MIYGSGETPYKENPDVAVARLFREYSEVAAGDINDPRTSGKIYMLLSDFRERIRLVPRVVSRALVSSEFRRYKVSAKPPAGGDSWDPLRQEIENILSSPLTPGQRNAVGDPPFRADVIVMTVIAIELQATKRAFGISDTQEEAFLYKGSRFYRSTVQTAGGRQLSVYVTMIGGPRNVRCANACRDIADLFNADSTLLLGVAAGNRKKVNLGDVVAANMVFDLEGGRLESVPILKFIPFVANVRPFKWWTYRRLVRRLEAINVPQSMTKDLEYFAPNIDELNGKTSQIISENVSWDKPIKTMSRSPNVKVHKGAVLSGEKLIANGSIPEVANSVNDQLYAGEMEGNGFAFTMKHLKTRWGIIRGISDFGDPEKEDGWQPAAAIAAAVYLIDFLTKGYRAPDEDIDF